MEFHDNLPYLTATACVEFFAPFISITALNLAVYLNIRKRSRGLIRSQKPHFTLPKEVTGAPTTTNPASAPPALPESNGKLHKLKAESNERKANSLTSNDIFISAKNAKKIFELANSTYVNPDACEVDDPKTARKRTTFSTKLTFTEPSNSKENTETNVSANKSPSSHSKSKNASKFSISPGAILKNKNSPNSYSSNSSSISIASSYYDDKKHSAPQGENGKLLMRFETEEYGFENDENEMDGDGGDSRADRDELIKLNEIIRGDKPGGHLTSEPLVTRSKTQSTRSKYKTTKFDNEEQPEQQAYGRSLSQPEPEAEKEPLEKQLIVKSNGNYASKKSHSQQTTSSAVLSKGGSIALSNASIPMSKKHSSNTLTKDKKAARSLFILVFVFVFCWVSCNLLTRSSPRDCCLTQTRLFSRVFRRLTLSSPSSSPCVPRA